MLWPAAQLAQETHGRGCVRQGGKACLMQCCNQHAASDADAFIDIIVLCLGIFLDPTFALGEYRDQIGRSFEKGFVLVRSNRGKGGKPLLAGFGMVSVGSVKAAFFALGGFANGALLVRRLNYGKVPWLMVCTVGRAARD